MAPRQNLPIVLDYGDGARLRAVTRTLDRSGLSFYIDARCRCRARVTRSRFEARIGGGGARGRARVLRVDHVDDGVGREMVAICDVLELHGAAERVIARAGFRERVVEFATKHRDGEKILEAAGGGLTRRMRPDTIADPSARGALGARADAAAHRAGRQPAPKWTARRTTASRTRARRSRSPRAAPVRRVRPAITGKSTTASSAAARRHGQPALRSSAAVRP